jgi:hypothetical protein
METVFYRMETGEQTAGLIAQTIRVALMDGRVSEVPLEMAPAVVRPYEIGVESEVDFVTRAWQEILPGAFAGQALDFRVKYGWTRAEIEMVKQLLHRVANALRVLAADVTLERTQDTLLMDFLNVMGVLKVWDDLLGK